MPTAADLKRDAYTEQFHVKDLFSTATPLLDKPKDGRETGLYHFQNVIGFRRVDRQTWMSEWRAQNTRTKTFA